MSRILAAGPVEDPRVVAGPAVGWAAFAGGIAPDVPAAIFYGWYCLLGGHTGIEIWEEGASTEGKCSI